MNTCCETPDTRRDATAAAESAVKPRYFVDGTKEAAEVRVEMAGVGKDGLSIDLDDNLLTIRGKRKDTVPAAWKPLHRELGSSDYLLRLRLNAQVDAEKLSAALDNGILTVRLPFKEAAKPRRIEVR